MGKVLYIGSFIPNEIFEEVWENSLGSLVFSGDKFQHALLQGILVNPNFIDEIITVPSIGSYPKRYRKLFFKGKNLIYQNTNIKCVSFFNLTFVKNYSIQNSLSNNIDKWVQKNMGNEITLFVYSLIEPYLNAALSVKKRYPKIKICCIVLDLPEFFNDNTSLLSKWIHEASARRIYKKLGEVDAFILLTSEMANRLKLQANKPWLLLEGIYSPVSNLKVEKEVKTLLYSGKLDLRFGIEHLVSAFSKIKDPDAKLWICGDGSARKYVEDHVRKDHRIIYFGVVKPDKAIELQHRANLLINPRKGDEEYTRFSFPSKTMEYLASGTPTIMYPLPGVPDEYFKYLVLVEDNTIETLSSILEVWLSKSQKELDAFGLTAKEFILNNKTSSNQAKRVFTFLQSLVN